MDKIILTKGQERSLMILLDDLDSKSLALEQHVLKVWSMNGWTADELKALNELSIVDLSRALYEGYEVYDEPTSKLRDYLESLKYTPYDERIIEEKTRSVFATLNILGIEIKGINK